VTGAVVFDGSVLGQGPVTGVGRAFLSTLSCYVANARRACVLVLPYGAADPGIDGIEIVRCRWRGPIGRELGLPRLLRARRACVLHSPVAALPLRAPCATVATVHDLPWLCPELRGEPGTALRQRFATRLACRRATVVIVPSLATRADLERVVPDGCARIEVVRHGVFRPATPADPEQLTGPFLVLGGDRPRKNLARLREAHARAALRCPDLPGLRLVGPDFGYVTEPEKVALLRTSRALAQVSLLEGFGLPVLEAFQHGVPVVCGDRGALPELSAGGAALSVDPHDLDAIADALVRIHTDLSLRHSLRERGLALARGLTPDRAAADWDRIHAEFVG
jgi:glycosyltransferase involved in cell wall biosynthesis